MNAAPKEATMKTSTPAKLTRSAVPLTSQRAHEIQAFGSVVPMPIALDERTRQEGAENLNQVLADTITLRDLYKKHHWQVSGRPSTNFTRCSTNISASRTSWWT
jgi:starvation-inducible DNA-binding protein